MTTMLKAKIITELDDSRWDTFANHHDLATIYHTSSWKTLVQNTYSHKPNYMVLEDDMSKIVAGLPLFQIKSRITGKRLTSIPCAQACDPLVSTENELRILLKAVKEIQNKDGFDYLELKTNRIFPFSSSIDADPQDEFCTYLLEIGRSTSDLLDSFHKNHTKRAINKSLKSNLTLIKASDESHVRSFYFLYSTMRKEKGLFSQPYSFFKNMWLIFKPQGQMEILLALHDGVVVASVLLLKHRDTVIYEYGASLPGSHNLRPSHFLLWSAIKEGQSEGCKYFDFGRTSKENKGLVDFKSRWGTDENDLCYYYLSDLNYSGGFKSDTKTKSLMNAIVKLSPNAVNDYLGKQLYRHLV